MLEDNVDEKFYLSATAVSSFLKSTFTQERDRLNTKDIAKTLCARDAHGPQLVSEPVIAASRGRNPDNPSDRTVGIPTEQRLEVKYDGCTNTLTSVQKDNYVVEPKILEEKCKNDRNKTIRTLLRILWKEIREKKIWEQIGRFQCFRKRKYCNSECMKKSYLKRGRTNRRIQMPTQQREI